MNRFGRMAMATACLAWAVACAFGDQKYVDAGVSGGANDGSSWANAYTNLQAALANTGSGTNLWVAQGAYYPGTARSDTFQLKTGVNLYGGFTNGMASLDERDWVLYETILSGDIGTPGAKTDNSYHIVTGCNTSELDGFTIAYGYANGAAPDNDGAAILNIGVSPAFRNCAIVSNEAPAGDPCGAMYNYNYAAPVVINCTFRKNASTAVHSYYGCAGWFQNCRFINNSAGVYTYHGDYAVFTSCVFAANGNYGLAPGYNGVVKAIRCVFSGNGGRGISINQAVPRVEYCLIGGNGGGINLTQTRASLFLVANSVVAGNSASGNGGGIYIPERCFDVMISNCTFAANYTAGKGGGLYVQDSVTLPSDPQFRNCIFWNNTAANGGSEIYTLHATATSLTTLSYDDIEGGVNGPKVIGAVSNVVGNIDADPRFAPVVTGDWETKAIFDGATGQSLLTDANAAWTSGQFVNFFLNPDTAQARQYVVATNTATTIAIWGDASAFAAAGDSYAVYDYHEQSKAGRWTPGGVWVKDRATSPCIDAGDTNSVWQREPEPNGGRINIGAYGNTPEASLSYLIPKVSLIIVR